MIITITINKTQIYNLCCMCHGSVTNGKIRIWIFSVEEIVTQYCTFLFDNYSNVWHDARIKTQTVHITDVNLPMCYYLIHYYMCFYLCVITYLLQRPSQTRSTWIDFWKRAPMITYIATSHSLLDTACA